MTHSSCFNNLIPILKKKNLGRQATVYNFLLQNGLRKPIMYYMHYIQWGWEMTYSIRLPHEIEKRLEDLAIRTGRSKSFYVKEAIIEHLDDIEDIYLAEKRLEDIRAGRTKTIPLHKVLKRYGMDS